MEAHKDGKEKKETKYKEKKFFLFDVYVLIL